MRWTGNRSLWMIPAIGTLVVLLFGWWTRREVSRAIENELHGQLQTVLEANVTALEIWIKNQERMADTLAHDPAVRQAALSLLAEAAPVGTNRTALARLPAQSAVQSTLDERLRTTTYLVAHLVGTNGVILGSSTRGRMRLGAPVSEHQVARFAELLATDQPQVITPFKVTPPNLGPSNRTNRGAFFGRRAPSASADRPPPEPPETGPRGTEARPRPGTPGLPGPFDGRGPLGRLGWRPRSDLALMQVIAPIRDDDARTVGALSFILRPEEEFTRVLSVARSGSSGETFAFDATGLLISQSRFDEQLKEFGLLPNEPGANSALTLELREPGGDLTRGFRLQTNEAVHPLIPMVADAIQGGAGVDVVPSPDYRGVPTVGAWRWLAKHNFGVATKVDAAEAFRPLRVLRLVFATLLLVLALCVVLLVLASYVGLVWRRRFDEARLTAMQLGQYTLEAKVGEGGMGVVYKARHALLRRDTAIKLLLPDRADEDAIRQFEHEVRLTCQLTHPNTIQIYDYGHTPEGIFYYAMEFLRGLSLWTLIQRFGPQPEARVIHLLKQVCASLTEAHAAGLIHRDIKPGNIFLCERGGVPDTVKLLDFGLVQRFHPDPASAPRPAAGRHGTTFAGTPMYMAPETIQDPTQGDPRSDLYAVGAVGYHLLTGRPVFDGASVAEICQRHLSEPPLPPSRATLNPISPELEALILRCLAKDPAHRPASAAEMLSALDACPHASAWTLEQRVAWWARQTPSPAALAPTTELLPSDPVNVTVKIALRSGSALKC